MAFVIDSYGQGNVFSSGASLRSSRSLSVVAGTVAAGAGVVTFAWLVATLATMQMSLSSGPTGLSRPTISARALPDPAFRSTISAETDAAARRKQRLVAASSVKDEATLLAEALIEKNQAEVQATVALSKMGRVVSTQVAAIKPIEQKAQVAWADARAKLKIAMAATPQSAAVAPLAHPGEIAVAQAETTQPALRQKDGKAADAVSVAVAATAPEPRPTSGDMVAMASAQPAPATPRSAPAENVTLPSENIPLPQDEPEKAFKLVMAEAKPSAPNSDDESDQPEIVAVPLPSSRPEGVARAPAKPVGELPPPVLAYASPKAAADEDDDDSSGGFFGKLFGGRSSKPQATAGTAIYDISAGTVYLPSGERLEAHSGIGYMRDNPKYVNQKMKGPTPPHTYALSMRESLFHGVQAIRMTPLGKPEKMFNRDGILAHTYMLRNRGDSNGCVVFKNYDKFLAAFKRGEIKRMIVVPKLNSSPASYASASR